MALVVLVKGLDDKKIVQIACGQQHSIVLDEEGYVRSSIIRRAS
jgi:alpha-tubulin suppressor-like RCC1 family protein